MIAEFEILDRILNSTRGNRKRGDVHPAFLDEVGYRYRLHKERSSVSVGSLGMYLTNIGGNDKEARKYIDYALDKIQKRGSLTYKLVQMADSRLKSRSA